MKKLLKKILVIAMCLSLCAAVTACDLPFGSSVEEEETSSRRKKDNKKKDSGDPEIPDILRADFSHPMTSQAFP